MIDLEQRIQAEIANRQVRKRRVDQYRANWMALGSSLEELTLRLSEVRRHLPTGDSLDDVAAAYSSENLQSDIRAVASALGKLSGRFGRSTLNIGVSGRARVGKSTLFQTIAGLDDSVIPTGKGRPVTAVRSRLFHSPSQATAKVTLYTEAGFIDQVLAPSGAPIE